MARRYGEALWRGMWVAEGAFLGGFALALDGREMHGSEMLRASTRVIENCDPHTVSAGGGTRAV